MTENELRINGKSFSETITQLEEFMESDNVHGELFSVLRSARDFMENLNEEIQQYRAIGTIEEFKALKDCGTHDCIIKHLTNECSYKETGCSDCKSIEMIRTAVERMKPKKPVYQMDMNGLKHSKCPNCGSFGIVNFCMECGQAVEIE